MKKGKPKILLRVLVITFAMLFVASEAMAFCDNCDPAGTLPISVTAGPYTITLDSISNTDDTDNPYQWNYRIFNTGTGTLTGLNFFAMLIPDCCTAPYPDITAESPGNLVSFDVAAGETTLNFGQYNQQAFVIKGTPDSSTIWSFKTTTNTMTTTTALLKYGKGKGDAVSVEIPGPGCAKPLDPTRVEIRTKCFQFRAGTDGNTADVTWYMEWNNPQDPCATEIWVGDGLYDGAACQELKVMGTKVDPEPLEDIELKDNNTTKALRFFSTNNNQCNEGWFRFLESGIETNNKKCYVSGGRRYCY